MRAQLESSVTLNMFATLPPKLKWRYESGGTGVNNRAIFGALSLSEFLNISLVRDEYQKRALNHADKSERNYHLVKYDPE